MFTRIALLAVGLALGCTPSPVKVPDTTKVLQTDALDALLSASDDLSTLVFSASAAGLGDLEPGDVMVGGVHPGTPYGMLRKVRSVDITDDTLTIETEAATLTEAIERGGVQATIDLSPQQAGLRTANKAFFFGLNDHELFDADGDPTTLDDRVFMDVSVSFRPTVGLDIDIDDFELRTLLFEIGAEMEASARVVAGRAAHLDERVTVIDEVELQPFVVSIGPVPVVFVPTLQFLLTTSGEVTANMSVGITANDRPRVAFGYENGSWGSDSTLDPTVDFDVPQFRDGASAITKVSVGPRASLAVYGVAGPYAELGAFVKAEVDVPADPWWRVSAGIEANAGVFVEVFGIDVVSHEFDPEEVEIPLIDAGGPAPVASEEVLTWSRTYSGASLDHATQVLSTSDGGSLVVGSSISFSNAPTDAWMLKLDALGQISWQIALEDEIAANGAIELDGGGYLVAMGSAGSGADGANLVRLDANGTVLWARALDHATDRLSVRGIEPTSDDGALLMGSVGSGVEEDFWLARASAVGDVVWARRIGGAAGDTPNALLRDGEDYVVAGATHSFGVSNIGGFAVAFHEDGDLLWQRVYDQPGSGNEVLTGLAPSPGGTRIVGHIFGEAILLEVDGSGALQSTTVYDSVDPFHQVLSAVGTDDGGMVLAGYTDIGDDSDTWILRLTATGTVLWSTAYGGPFGEEAGAITSWKDLSEAIAISPDDGLLIASNVQRPKTSWDLWLLKTSETGVITFDDATYDGVNLSGSFTDLAMKDLATSEPWQPLTLTSSDMGQLDVLSPAVTVETQKAP